MQMDAGEGGLKSEVRKCFESQCGVEELSGAETTGNGEPD
jgi:hypothetical protein